MLTHPIAQELVDGLSTVTLFTSVLAIAQRPPSLLRPRLSFAFGGAFLLFAVRTGANALNMPSLSMLALVIVCALPLAALLLAEGLLRRHAFWPLKVVVTLGAVAIAVGLLVSGGTATAATLWVGCFVIPSLAAIALMLLAREKASLSEQENASVKALIGSGLFLIASSVTGFLPQAPLGLSGIGAALVAFVLGANPNAANETRNVMLSVLAMIIMAALSALAMSHSFGLEGRDEQIRLGAIFLSLLLASNSILGVLHRFASRANQDFARALGDADVSSLDNFLNSVADQPLLAGLRIAKGPMLAEYDVKSLAATMKTRAVWTRPILADKAMQISARARDELRDLMTRTDASHAVLVSEMPLRIALLTLPEVGSADSTEINLALFHKLAAASALGQP
jgi:hypothetical protein